jgi:protein-tyrosine phosphatase
VRACSRSATTVLAYLVKRRNMTLKDALRHVRMCRPAVYPNKGFMRFLMELDKNVHGESSLPPDLLCLHEEQE